MRKLFLRKIMVGLRLRLLPAALLAAGLICLLSVQPVTAQDNNAAADESRAAAATNSLYLPVLSNFGMPAPICRLGVNTSKAQIYSFNLSELRIGWYINYQASTPAPLLNAAAHAAVINLEQVGASGYRSIPSGDALDEAIAANRNGDWIIGNEPDRRYYQNDLVPQAYARAYHDLYQYIKAKDASARIFAGAIVQPTPLRLQYLDGVLRHYLEMYGEQLPADGWAIHNFILNERSCSHYNDPFLCWGADIPPGSSAIDGLIIDLDDLQKTADVAFFKQQVVGFRQWMADNGYRNRPLYISEFGILMPADRGFPPALVNNYMNQTFDFLIKTTDEKLGYAADNNRLVQRLAWYSTLDPSFNGSLYEGSASDPLSPPFTLTAIGENYRAYANAMSPASEFKLLDLTQTAPIAPVVAGEGVTLTLNALVANAGNNQWAANATVRFYLGDPATGGEELGSAAVQLPGCGRTTAAQFVWRNVPEAANGQDVYARLQAQGVDTQMRVQVLIANNLLAMPLLRRLVQ